MLRIELRDHLDAEGLAAIQGLIDAARRIEGHSPVGEHKASHLAVGAKSWVGVLAFDDDQLVGYAHTRWNAPGAQPRLAVEVVVHPAQRQGEVARRLLNEVRSVLGRAGGGTLFLWVHRVEDAHRTLAAEMDFAIQRDLAYMVREGALGPPGDLGDLPAGVTVRPFDGEVDAFLAVNNAAFAGHPENGGWTHEDFSERAGLTWFDPDDLLMAWRGEELAGFHWTKWHAHSGEPQPAHGPRGEVYVLAVAPAAQGLGLGRTLLRRGLVHLHEKGVSQVVLYVDRADGRAEKLYASEGFELRYHEVCYAEEVWPVVDHQTADLYRPA